MERTIELQKANETGALADAELNTVTGGGLFLGAAAAMLLMAAPYASTAAAIALLSKK